MKKNKTNYTDEIMKLGKIVKDFLPPPYKLTKHMEILVDNLRGIYRCNCGRLYKNSGSFRSDICDKCRDLIDQEWKKQQERDLAIEQLKTLGK